MRFRYLIRLRREPGRAGTRAGRSRRRAPSGAAMYRARHAHQRAQEPGQGVAARRRGGRRGSTTGSDAGSTRCGQARRDRPEQSATRPSSGARMPRSHGSTPREGTRARHASRPPTASPWWTRSWPGLRDETLRTSLERLALVRELRARRPRRLTPLSSAPRAPRHLERQDDAGIGSGGFLGRPASACSMLCRD